jgi:hypothetical protein
MVKTPDRHGVYKSGCSQKFEEPATALQEKRFGGPKFGSGGRNNIDIAA